MIIASQIGAEEPLMSMYARLRPGDNGALPATTRSSHMSREGNRAWRGQARSNFEVLRD